MMSSRERQAYALLAGPYIKQVAGKRRKEIRMLYRASRLFIQFSGKYGYTPFAFAAGRRKHKTSILVLNQCLVKRNYIAVEDNRVFEILFQ